MHSRLDGIGMTSARTRERLIRRLVDQGIQDVFVVETTDPEGRGTICRMTGWAHRGQQANA